MLTKLTNKIVNMIMLLLLTGCQAYHSITQQKTVSKVAIESNKAPASTHHLFAKKYKNSYIIHGQGTAKRVALTFDDGPSVFTKQILAILSRNHVKATFFIIGKNAKETPDLVYQIHQQGHLIANHSWNHSDLALIASTTQFWQHQIQPTNAVISKITGTQPSLYRPPFGHVTDQQIQVLNNNNIKTIIWSVDSQDWNDNTNTVDHIIDLATSPQTTQPIILMHDGGGNRQHTVDALEKIITYYRNNNYQFVTVDELIQTR